jgi:hypothetical protein
MPLTIKHRLALLWRRFSPLEERLLAAVRTALPTAAQSLYDAQVAGITLVQRHPPWTEIRFYRIRQGKLDWSDVPSFPCTDEFRLARVRFSVQAKSYTATINCIHGHIFDFAVSPSPKQVAFALWDGAPSVQLLNDPLRAPTGRRQAENIPPTWRKFLLQHSGQAISGWVLYDENTAYRVPSENGEYLLLAERNGDEFIVQNLEGGDEPQDRLLYLDSHDSTPEPICETLEDLIRHRQARKR